MKKRRDHDMSRTKDGPMKKRSGENQKWQVGVEREKGQRKKKIREKGKLEGSCTSQSNVARTRSAGRFGKREKTKEKIGGKKGKKGVKKK